MGNDISLVLFAFLRGGLWKAITKAVFIFQRIFFCILVVVVLLTQYYSSTSYTNTLTCLNRTWRNAQLGENVVQQLEEKSKQMADEMKEAIG